MTLAQSYDPFGNLSSQHGTQNPQLPFGYTGEWWDAEAGLLYLRARYYDAGVGRFVSKDPWPGDPNQPQTLSGFVYVLNNSPNRTDPSGYVPTREEAGTKYMYSCNCGWIDWTHAGPGTAWNLLDIVEESQTPGIPGMELDLSWWTLVRDVGAREGPEFGVSAGVSGDVYVHSGLTRREQWEVSLGIYISLENAFEAWQGGAAGYPIGMWRGIVGKIRDRSSFSEEDLLSDLIGFHRALMSARLGKSGDETMKDFMAICGVVGRDSPDFIEKQQAIYDEYMKLGGFVKVRQWGRPCLGRLSGQDCPSDPKIPYELTWLQPRPPDPPDQPSAVNNFGGANGWFWSDAYFFMQFDNRPKEFVGGYGLGSQLNRQSLNWNPSHYSYPPQYAPVN